MNKQRVVSTALMVFFGFLVLLFISSGAFITIEAGQKGVLFKKFSGGLDIENVYAQGFHLIAPWNKMYIYDVREQIKEESMSVLSSDGLDIKIDVSVRFRPVQDKIGFLHDEIGKMYRETIVADLTRATVRRIIGRYTPEEIYRNKREEIETRLQEELTISLEDKYIVLESALLREIKLPEQIENAIQDKLKAKEEAAKIDFQIERQKKESERIRIEALAKAEANRILSASLTDKILQEKGILATQELAKSPNTKVVVVGGKDGLPLILNQ
ncbi:MAG: prohibitin family protein [Bacteroidota bacterium]